MDHSQVGPFSGGTIPRWLALHLPAAWGQETHPSKTQGMLNNSNNLFPNEFQGIIVERQTGS